jgi:hypothetical protein
MPYNLIEMDYDEILVKLKNTEYLPSYDFLIALEKIILNEDLPVLVHELAVFSGLALRFVYNFENPLIYEDIPYFALELKKYLGFELLTYSVDFLNQLEPPFIITPKNILVIGDIGDTLTCEHEFEGFEQKVFEVSPSSRIVKLQTRKIDRAELYDKSKFTEVIYEVHKNYYEKDVKNSYYIGKHAFKEFLNDLGDLSKEREDRLSLVLKNTIRDQLSSLYGLRVYLLGYYHFLGNLDQKVLFEGLNALGDAIMFYREFERVTKEALIKGQFTAEVRRRGVNSMKKFIASFEHFLYSLEKLI